MLATRYARIIQALEEAQVRYLIAGGVAVNLHGFVRFTKDLDLMIDLEPSNASKAMAVMESSGLRPRLPVGFAEFTDPVKREDWFRNRNMIVFQVWDPADPFCSIDVFVRNPLDFDAAWSRAAVFELGFCQCRATTIDDLILMKTAAARPQDHRDIEELRFIQRISMGLRQ
jgi:hypothetical protein